MPMTRENIERAARIFDAARRDDRFVDEIPAEPGLDNLADLPRPDRPHGRCNGFQLGKVGRKLR